MIQQRSSAAGEEASPAVKRPDGLRKELAEFWVLLLELVIDGPGGRDKGGSALHGITARLESKNVTECVGVECLDQNRSAASSFDIWSGVTYRSTR